MADYCAAAYNAPHEANKLPRDRSADDGRLFSTCTECAVSGCKASLRFPRDLPYAWWRGFNFVELLFADPWRMAVGPGTFDQQMPHTTIACLGDAAAPNRVARRAFTWSETEIAHKLTRIVEAAEIAELRGTGNGHD